MDLVGINQILSIPKRILSRWAIWLSESCHWNQSIKPSVKKHTNLQWTNITTPQTSSHTSWGAVLGICFNGPNTLSAGVWMSRVGADHRVLNGAIHFVTLMNGGKVKRSRRPALTNMRVHTLKRNFLRMNGPPQKNVFFWNKITGWCSTPTQLLICSSFNRENGHPLLICSSLSTAQISNWSFPKIWKVYLFDIHSGGLFSKITKSQNAFLFRDFQHLVFCETIGLRNKPRSFVGGGFFCTRMTVEFETF